MSAIRQALEYLNGAVENLEGSIDGFQRAMSEDQRDMFFHIPKAGPGSGNTEADSLNGIDPTVVVQRLDSAIEKVEDMLEEA